MKQSAKIYKSVSDETRLRILLLLATHTELCVCDVMAALDLPQSTVSRHLAYLKNAGWLDDQRRGIWMHYSLTHTPSTTHQDILASLVTTLATSSEHMADQQRLTSNLKRKASS